MVWIASIYRQSRHIAQKRHQRPCGIFPRTTFAFCSVCETVPRRAPRSDDPARSTHCVTPTQSHLVTAHASEATTTWAACAQRRPRYVGQARTVKNSPRSGIGTVKGRARECNRNGPNQGSSSVRAAPDIAKICTKPLISDRGDRFARRGVCQPRHIRRNDASVAAVET